VVQAGVDRWEGERVVAASRRVRGPGPGRTAQATRRERLRRSRAQTELREQGLVALLADVLEGDRPPAELLVRYARDAAALEPAEREQIEWHLAHTPGYRAELSILRRFLAQQGSGAAQP
jgi:hypothetical protein